MPFFRIPVTRRKKVEQSGTVEIEAPTAGDAYILAGITMTDEELVAKTNWHGPVTVEEDEMFLPAPERSDAGTYG